MTKAGPFEFQRIQAPGETLEGVRAVLRGGISLLGGELAKVVNDEAVAFLALDWFFAPRTKLMLLWLSQRESVAISEFNETAARLGIPPDNLAATWTALLGTGAAAVADGRASLTREGKRYASHLLLASAL